jgi:uncharacterized protein (DUF1501 family)
MTAHPRHALFGSRFSRRSFLTASTAACFGLPFGPSVSAAQNPEPRSKSAKSTVLFFLCGGASHIDMWDMKPNAPVEYRGEFQSIRTSAPDIQLCEHLPLLAKNAHRFSLIHGVTDAGRATGDHHAGYYYNLTGHEPDITFKQQGNDRRPMPTDWPHMGCVVGMKVKGSAKLPGVITLPHKPSKAPYTRPGQFAGRIGLEHDPFFLNGSFEKPLEFSSPTLSFGQGLTPERIRDRESILQAMSNMRRELDHDASVTNYSKQQQRAFELLSASGTAGAFDIKSESPRTLDRYGSSVNATSLVMARRLVEAGVPFITVFWKENEAIANRCKSAGGWDTHGSNFACLREYLLPEFDRAFSAFLEDLSDRHLLDQTLVLVSSEMGRKPLVGDPRTGGKSGAGRDHWTACMSVLMAGGGVQGGRIYGGTDKRAEYPDSIPVSPSDVTKTVYHAMGIDNLEATDTLGRPYNLLDEGRPILDLFS